MSESDQATGIQAGKFLASIYLGVKSVIPNKIEALNLAVYLFAHLAKSRSDFTKGNSAMPFSFVVNADDFEKMRLDENEDKPTDKQEDEQSDEEGMTK